MSFLDLLESAKGRDRDTASVDVTVAGELVTFEFAELPGPDWADVTSKNPPRLELAIDRSRGYNVHAASRDAAVLCGTVDGEKLTAEQWADVFVVLSGHDHNRVCDTIWSLNEYAPMQRLAAAKKASRAKREGGSS